MSLTYGPTDIAKCKTIEDCEHLREGLNSDREDLEQELCEIEELLEQCKTKSSILSAEQLEAPGSSEVCVSRCGNDRLVYADSAMTVCPYCHGKVQGGMIVPYPVQVALLVHNVPRHVPVVSEN